MPRKLKLAEALKRFTQLMEESDRLSRRHPDCFLRWQDGKAFVTGSAEGRAEFERVAGAAGTLVADIPSLRSKLPPEVFAEPDPIQRWCKVLRAMDARRTA